MSGAAKVRFEVVPFCSTADRAWIQREYTWPTWGSTVKRVALAVPLSVEVPEMVALAPATLVVAVVPSVA